MGCKLKIKKYILRPFQMTKHWADSGIILCIRWSKDFRKGITKVWRNFIKNSK